MVLLVIMNFEHKQFFNWNPLYCQSIEFIWKILENETVRLENHACDVKHISPHTFLNGI